MCAAETGASELKNVKSVVAAYTLEKGGLARGYGNGAREWSDPLQWAIFGEHFHLDQYFHTLQLYVQLYVQSSF